MRSPKKGRAPRLTLADLAPAQIIDCFLCQQPKPAEGARSFRAHKVCAACTHLLDTQSTATAAQPATTT